MSRSCTHIGRDAPKRAVSAVMGNHVDTVGKIGEEREEPYSCASKCGLQSEALKFFFKIFAMKFFMVILLVNKRNLIFMFLFRLSIKFTKGLW